MKIRNIKIRNIKTVLLFIVVVLVSVSCAKTNTNTNIDTDILINSGEDNIEFFEIDDNQLTNEYLKSEEFTENIYDNIEKNIDLNIDSEKTIVINKPVDELKYKPYKVYLSEDSKKVKNISSDYGIKDNSDNKDEDNFYIEDFTIENNQETHFTNRFNSVIFASSHYPNVKIYFAKISDKYIVFSVNG